LLVLDGKADPLKMFSISAKVSTDLDNPRHTKIGEMPFSSKTTTCSSTSTPFSTMGRLQRLAAQNLST
jgi:hypothetical protein